MLTSTQVECAICWSMNRWGASLDWERFCSQILSFRTTVSTARKRHLYHTINEENGDLKLKCKLFWTPADVTLTKIIFIFTDHGNSFQRKSNPISDNFDAGKSYNVQYVLNKMIENWHWPYFPPQPHGVQR